MIDRLAIKLRPNKKLHSREHVLADDLCKTMAEPKRFAAYLGIAWLHHEEDLRALAKRVLAKRDLPMESRGKYFFASLKDLPKRSKPVRLKISNVKNRNGKK